jgi:ABC-type transporter Mla subunit MlaD
MAIGGSGKGIQIIVGTQYNDKDLKRAQRDLDKLKGEAAKSAGPFGKLGSTLKNNLGPALAMAGAAAGAFAIKLGVDGVKAAIEDQKSVEVLAQTLQNLGQAHRQTGVEDFIASMESAYGVADERLRPALGKLAVATGSVDEAQQRLSQAMDISVGTGQELEGVVKALGRATATQSKGPLSRFGLILDDNTIKTKGFNAALDEAAATFAGVADREAKTLSGQLRILGVEFDNIKEAFGYGFLSGVGDAGSSIDSMTNLMRDLHPVARDLGEQIGGIASAMSELESATSLVSGVVKGLTDVTGPTADALLFLNRTLRHGEDPANAFMHQMFGVGEAQKKVADVSGTVAAGIAQGESAARTAAPMHEELTERLEAEADAAEKAAQEFDKLAAAIKRTGTITSYQASIDKLKKTLTDTKGATSIFNEEGRKSVAAYVDLAKNAGDYIDSLDSTAQKASTAESVLGTLTSQLGKTKMDPQTQQALLAPFQGLIDDLRESGMNVDRLQAKLDKLKNKTIEVRVNTTTYGRPPGVSDREWYGARGGMVPKFYAGGGMSRGMDTVPAMLAPGEFIVRRQAVKQFGADLFSQLNRGINPLAGMEPSGSGRSGGMQIGTINVTAVSGERADQSLPRALRRMAFLAGMNG